MKHLLWNLLAVGLFLCLPVFGQTDITTLEKNFRHISEDQKLAVYWYWMSGNMSKEGVVKDLQAMKSVGINRVQVGLIGEGQGAPLGPVKFFTEEWWDIMHTMMKTAGELNIEVGLFNCPGWSQSGGPWVKPEQAMRYLANVKDTVEGGTPLNKQLPALPKEAQDVKVLAFPLIEQQVFQTTEDINTATTFNFTTLKPTKVRSLVVYPKHVPFSTNAELFVNENGQLRSIQKFNLDRSNPGLNVGCVPFAPIVISLPETEGKQFQLKIGQAGIIEQLTLSDVPQVERYPEKSLTKMWQTPHPMWDAYMWREQPHYAEAPVVKAKEVIDLTEKMDNGGHIQWTAPKGQKWVIMRTAMLPTGTTNAPAPQEATGYETDKMSKKHIRAHFDNYLGEIMKRIPAEDRKTFRIVVEDSYETGGQNWTDDMIPDFKKRYGYDPTPFIPVLDGVVINSQEESDRFLWDLRRLVADEVSYNYVGGLAEISHEHGLTTWLENYGHWGFPGEFLQYGGQSDEIAGEFWSFGDLGDIENKLAASCGHIYGKKKVWAESFTCGGPDFTQYPGQMKQRGDRFFTEGINATLYHLYIQQPDDRKPGINANFGNEFNRNNTWFHQLDVFNRYIKRCNYMLQEGLYVADIAYFLGEDAPKMTGVRNPEVPRGYSYDYINAEILLKASVEDGKLSLPSGMKYRVLVLPKIKTMRPEVLRKIQQLVKEGMVIIGPAPSQSPSLQDWPNADKTVQAIAEEMWQTGSNPFANSINYGKGHIYPDASLEQVLNDYGDVPDFSSTDPTDPLLFIHRHLGDADYYFISNQSDKEITFDANFRIRNKQPELWNPLTSEVRLLPEFKQLNKTTQIPLVLKPFESSFIMFHRAVSEIQGQNFPEKQVIATFTTPWTVQFEAPKGGPEQPVKFDQLIDWTKSSDQHIKYFSGTAIYTNTFKLKKLPAQPTYIDLGKVMVMAKVKINGQYVGGVWTAPYRLNVTNFLKKGENSIEVEVVNCWRNRLIGEKHLPENKRFTFQTATYLNKDSELQSSGLIGPVEIQTYHYSLVNE